VQSAVLWSHCRLSVSPSVRLWRWWIVIGGNSSEIISPLVSLGCSLSETRTSGVHSKGNTRKFWPKVNHPRRPLLIWTSETSIANCGRMVTDIATITMESLQETTNAVSNGAIADPFRPSLSPKWGFHMPPRYANDHNIRNGWYDTLHVWF